MCCVFLSVYRNMSNDRHNKAVDLSDEITNTVNNLLSTTGIWHLGVHYKLRYTKHRHLCSLIYDSFIFS